MEHAAILAADPRIDCESLPDRIRRGAGQKAPPYLGGDYTLEEIEREHIQLVLGRAASAEADVLTEDPS
jgi:hypothetical protein